MIGLSINEDPKLEKGKEKKGSAARGFIRSSGHVTMTVQNSKKLSAIVCHNPPFFTSAITLPLLLKKPALRLYISVSCPWGILIFILNKQLIIFAILAFYLLVQILQGSWLVRVLVIEFFKLLGATYKVLGRVLGWVQIITFLLDTVFQRSLYQFTGQYFINFLFIVAINLNQQQRLILLSRQQVIYSFLQLIQ